MEQPPNRVSYSGPLVPGVGWTKAAKKYDDVSVVSTRTNLSSLSGLVASRTLTSEDARDKYFRSNQIAADQAGRVSESFDKLGSSRNQDMKLQTQGITSSHQIENLRGSTKESSLVSFMTKLSNFVVMKILNNHWMMLNFLEVINTYFLSCFIEIFFRMVRGSREKETRSISLGLCLFHQTMLIRCLKIMTAKFRKQLDEQELRRRE